MTNLQKLRELLQDLTYSEMMTLADWFANIDKEDGRPINDASFWAFHFNDWAENVELAEDDEEVEQP